MQRTREERRASLLEFSKKYPDRGSYAGMLALDDKYPELDMFGPNSCGAEVGEGWLKLLEPCLEVLRRYACTVTQIKSKFCELVVYWDGPVWVRPAVLAWYESGKKGPNPEDLFEEVKRVIAVQAGISLYTCERCGEAARDGEGKQMGGVRLCEPCRLRQRHRHPFEGQTIG